MLHLSLAHIQQDHDDDPAADLVLTLRTVLERVADPESDVHDIVVVRMEVAQVRRYLRRLPELERRVIVLLYGLAGERVSHRQAAARFGLSRRALAGVEERALDRLRSMYQLSEAA